MKHVVVDLETMSSRNNAAIVAIGGFAFDEGQVQWPEPVIFAEQEFFNCVSLESSLAHGLHLDPKTVVWWLGQEKLARWGVSSPSPYTLPDALVNFTRFVKNFCGTEKFVLWGNGAGFDNVILRSAFEAAQIEYPVGYRQDRCYRTIKALMPEVIVPEYDGTHHHAGHDAIRQGLHLQLLLKNLSTVKAF